MVLVKQDLVLQTQKRAECFISCMELISFWRNISLFCCKQRGPFSDVLWLLEKPDAMPWFLPLVLQPGVFVLSKLCASCAICHNFFLGLGPQSPNGLFVPFGCMMCMIGNIYMTIFRMMISPDISTRASPLASPKTNGSK